MAYSNERGRNTGYSRAGSYHGAMSGHDDIVNPLDGKAGSKRRRRTWYVWVFDLLVLIFAAFHLYAFVLKFVPVPGTILMAQRAIAGENIKRNWTRLEDISPFLVSAVIAGEDARFCQHHGIDLDAIQDAISDNQSRERRRGGSTITQQTAKNVFLWNGGGFIRKVPETWMASFIDYVWGKQRVLEMYLNIAEWGDGLFGAEAAAQNRFGKSANDLNPREAALLASVLPSPNKWRLDPPGDYVNKRARTLQTRLYAVRNEGYADCVLGKATKRIGPKPKPKPAPTSEPDPKEKLDEKDQEVESTQPAKSETDPQSIEETIEPVVEEAHEASPEEDVPESEGDTGIEIKPERP